MRCLVCKSSSQLFMENLFDDRYGAPGRFSICRCGQCGFGRISPSLDRKEIGGFYAKFYPLSTATPQTVKTAVRILPKWKAWLLGVNNIAHHFIRPNTKILDIGSASGVSLLEIKQLGGMAFGVEPDPKAQKLAKALNLNVFQGQITDNPFPNEKFDFITASQVIEHVPDPVEFLQRINRRLSDGGQVILSFPNFNALYRHILGRRWLHWHVPYHQNFFTKDSFTRLAAQADLRVIKIKTITPNLWTIIQLRSLLIKPVEGKTGAVWAAQYGRKQTGAPQFVRVLITILRAIAGLPIGFGNRVIDMFGQGESFVVWLERTK